MGTSSEWRARCGALLVCVGAAFVVSCSDAPPVAAPVLMKGGPGDLGEPGVGPPPRSAPRRETRHVTVKPGQSLGGIAQAYHLSERTIIDANHLKPPYKVTAGMRLRIPGAAVSPVQQAAVARAPLA